MKKMIVFLFVVLVTVLSVSASAQDMKKEIENAFKEASFSTSEATSVHIDDYIRYEETENGGYGTWFKTVGNQWVARHVGEPAYWVEVSNSYYWSTNSTIETRILERKLSLRDESYDLLQVNYSVVPKNKYRIIQAGLVLTTTAASAYLFDQGMAKMFGREDGYWVIGAVIGVMATYDATCNWAIKLSRKEGMVNLKVNF